LDGYTESFTGLIQGLDTESDNNSWDKPRRVIVKAENRISDQHLDLFAGRTSSHRWWPT